LLACVAALRAMTPEAQDILAHLHVVATERHRRAASAGLSQRVLALKAYQQRRFSLTYADLLATPRYSAVARFFLDELYGPHDFTERDAQLARVVPTLVRLFPDQIVGAVRGLAELHALSEQLDSRMAAQLPSTEIDAAAYLRAWQCCAAVPQREQQIALTLALGQTLDRLTRNPMLRQSLRLMRGPARAAGLGHLQGFLETGFDTFKAMGGADEFLAIVAQRERALAAMLFGPSPVELGAGADTPHPASVQLP
jgi:hypothetical protein